MGFWDKMLAVDRRWIFLLVFFALLIPMLPMFRAVTFRLSISPEVQTLFDALEAAGIGFQFLELVTDPHPLVLRGVEQTGQGIQACTNGLPVEPDGRCRS